jgi:hypothetical protein
MESLLETNQLIFRVKYHVSLNISYLNGNKTLKSPVPPLFEKTVYLEMNVQEKTNMNALIAQVKLNSILTEKEGPDYLNHPSQRKQLQQVVSK